MIIIIRDAFPWFGDFGYLVLRGQKKKYAEEIIVRLEGATLATYLLADRPSQRYQRPVECTSPVSNASNEL